MFSNKKAWLIVTLILITSLVTALEVKKTEFVIKTEPYRNLSISVINSDTKEEIEIFSGRARKFGEFRFTYYGVISKVSLKAIIIDNETGSNLKEEELGPYTLGTPSITLDFYLLKSETTEVEATEEIIEELNASTEVDTNELSTDENSLHKNKIIGFVTGENGEFLNIYYFIGAGTLGAIILIFLFKRKISSSIRAGPIEPHPNKIIKSKTIKPSKEELQIKEHQSKEVPQSSISDTEKRILDLQKQLEEIRSEEKLLKLQKQINSEKDELKKLQTDLEPKKPQNSENNLDNNTKTL